jgi:hypothetical protein
VIVVATAGALRLVTQPDHAHFAGELLSLWRRDGLPSHPRRGDLLFAAREHDNGWREADAAPRVDPTTRRPHAFPTLPDEPRRELWLRGAHRFVKQRPWASALIVEHAVRIHHSRRGEPDWAEFLGGLTELRAELMDGTETAERELANDYRFLDLADALSLAACNRWNDPFERRGVRGRFDKEIHTLYIHPFPLAGTTSFQLPARRIAKRRYEGDADLGGALAAATWMDLPVRVAPLAEKEHLSGAATEPP